MRKQIDIVDDFCAWSGMCSNNKKCGYGGWGPDTSHECIERESKTLKLCTANNEKGIPHKQEYTYLGALISLDNNSTTNIEQLKKSVKDKVDKLVDSELTAEEMTIALNECVLSAIRYHTGMGLLSPEQENELSKIIAHGLLRKQNMRKGAGHDPVFMEKNRGGLGLTSVETISAGEAATLLQMSLSKDNARLKEITLSLLKRLGKRYGYSSDWGVLACASVLPRIPRSTPSRRLLPIERRILAVQKGRGDLMPVTNKTATTNEISIHEWLTNCEFQTYKDIKRRIPGDPEHPNARRYANNPLENIKHLENLDCNFIRPLWKVGLYNMNQLTGPYGTAWTSILGLKRQATGPWPAGATAAIRLIQYLASLDTIDIIPHSTTLLRSKSKSKTDLKLNDRWKEAWAPDNSNPIIAIATRTNTSQPIEEIELQEDNLIEWDEEEVQTEQDAVYDEDYDSDRSWIDQDSDNDSEFLIAEPSLRATLDGITRDEETNIN